MRGVGRRSRTRAGRTLALPLGTLLALSINVFAQTNDLGTVKGTVVDDSTSQPLEFVDVLLLKKADSTLVTGQVTESSGKFLLKDVPFGEYVLKLTLVGYREKSTPAFSLSAHRRHLNLESIPLTSAAVALEPVTVTAEKALFDYSIDRKVYNVDQDILSRAGSATDLLENIPSVSVDANGAVILRGSTKVLLMINGRTSPLLDKRSGNFLEQIPASSIEKIEVITNPSARFKAEGKAGIINIVLKKDTPLGTHGLVAANMGDNGRYNGHLRLNYNPGSFNLYGTYSMRRITRNILNADAREELTGTAPASIVSSTYEDDLFSYAAPLSHLASLGIDYHPERNTTFGASASYFHDAFSRTDSSLRVLRDSTTAVINDYDRDSKSDELEEEFSTTAYVHHAFANENHKLKLEATYSRSPKDENSYFTNLYFVPPLPTTFDNAFVDEGDTRTQLTADYANPLTPKTLLEAGYAGEFSTSSLDFTAEFFAPRQHQFVVDPRKTSEYLLRESINAFYLTLKSTAGPWGFLLGARAEHESRTSELATIDSSVFDRFFSIYPSAHLSYRFSAGSELQLNYSRRTSRPRARDLDPFPEYRDPRNTFLGRPDLAPEDIHSAELGYHLESDRLTFVPSLFYRYSRNSLTSLKQLVNRTTLLTARENLSSDQSGGIEVILSIIAGDALTTHVSASGFYHRLDASNLGLIQNVSAWSWTGTWTSHINFSKSSLLQINAHFSSLRLTPQGEFFPSSVVNVGFRQDLFDSRLSLLVSVADLFKSVRRHFELDIPGLHQTVLTSRQSRYVYLGFTYRFGVSPKKSGEEQWHYEDEDENE